MNRLAAWRDSMLVKSLMLLLLLGVLYWRLREKRFVEQRAARLAQKTGAVLQRAIDSAKGPGTGTLGSGA